MKPVAPILLALLLLSAAASAQDAPSEAKAREYFTTGTSHFEAGRYLDAQAAFAAGFELSRKPGFLWNMAECARLLGNDARAVELYQRFLKEAPQNAPRRKEAEQRVGELSPRTETKPPPPAPLVPRVLPATPASTDAEGPPPVEKSSDGPLHTRWWFWTGAGALVAAAAVVTVVVVANKSGGSAGGGTGAGADHTVDWRSWRTR